MIDDTEHQPRTCEDCAKQAPNFPALLDGAVMIGDENVPFNVIWVCGMETEDGVYHGPLIELRPNRSETILTALKRLGWRAN